MLICERHHDYLLKGIFLVLQKKSYLKWQFFILHCKYLQLQSSMLVGHTSAAAKPALLSPMFFMFMFTLFSDDFLTLRTY